ncbi:MAG: hypothetical protein QNJ74_16280 [Trichodesmium sp. MO_231.B1]|nr:hypothetical protein [Trichodesmium sp. MO_231.B1]
MLNSFLLWTIIPPIFAQLVTCDSNKDEVGLLATSLNQLIQRVKE